jgi:hypothetical protein
MKRRVCYASRDELWQKDRGIQVLGMMQNGIVSRLQAWSARVVSATSARLSPKRLVAKLRQGRLAMWLTLWSLRFRAYRLRAWLETKPIVQPSASQEPQPPADLGLEHQKVGVSDLHRASMKHGVLSPIQTPR